MESKTVQHMSGTCTMAAGRFVPWADCVTERSESRCRMHDDLVLHAPTAAGKHIMATVQ